MQIAALQKKTTTSPDSHTQKGSATLPAAPVYQQKPIQKMELEEEQPMQAKLTTQFKTKIIAAPPPIENNDNTNDGIAQLKELEEEMPVQGKFIAQRMELKEEQPLQG